MTEQKKAIKRLAKWAEQRAYAMSEGSEDLSPCWAINKYLDLLAGNVRAFSHRAVNAPRPDKTVHHVNCKQVLIAALDATHATIDALEVDDDNAT